MNLTEQFRQLCAAMKTATGKDKALIASKLMILSGLVQDESIPVPEDIFVGLDADERRMVLTAFVALMAATLKS